MNTDPAVRIVCTRINAASAVGKNPRNAIAIVVRLSTQSGGPSTHNMAGISAAEPTTSNRADITMASIGGHSRVRILDTA